MKNVKTFLFLSFAGLLLVATQAASSLAQTLDKESLELSVIAEQRIQKSVDNLLGENSRAVVNVYIESSSFEENQSASETDEGASVDTSFEGLWYLPNSYLHSNVSSGLGQSQESLTAAKTAEVVIQVEEAVTDEVLEQISVVSKRILRGIPTNVEVLTNLAAPIPPVEEASRAPASLGESAEESSEEPVEELNELQKLLNEIKGAEPIIAGLLILLGLIMAFGFLGLMLRSSANSLTEGIKQISTRVTNSGSQKIELSKESSLQDGTDESSDETEENAKAKRTQLPPHPFVGEEAEKLVQSLEKLISENPTVFMKSISEDVEDLLGLKFLISKVSPESRTRIKEVLGLEHIMKAASFQYQSEGFGLDARAWTQGLIEKIEIQLLAGGGVVEESIDAEQSLVLASCPPDALFTEALRSQSPAVWRVASEFLSDSYLHEHSDDLDDEALKLLIASTDAGDKEAITRAAQELVEALRSQPATESTGTTGPAPKRANTNQFFTSKILPAIAESVLSRELGEDDSVLASLMEVSPEYRDALNEKIWTPAKLRQIPDESLGEIFAKIDDEKKANIIFKLPHEYKERMTSFVPKGNSKRIVADLISKLEASATEKKHREMKDLTREFLDYLRSQYAAGKLQLVSEHTSPLDSEPQRKAS